MIDFEYIGGGYFRKKGVPVGEKAETLHGWQAIEACEVAAAHVEAIYIDALRILRINLFSPNMFVGEALDVWVTEHNKIVDAALDGKPPESPAPDEEES